MRSYGDACGITRALDLIGERWAIPVIRELMFGPRRYSDLADALPGVSTNILGNRLKELTQSGVVVKKRLPPPAATNVYELTAWGASLETTLIELGRWGASTPYDLEQQTFGASSFALSLKTTFEPELAAGVSSAVRLTMNEDIFDAEIHSAQLSIQRATSDVTEAPAEVRGFAPSLAKLFYSPITVEAAHDQGDVQVIGETPVVSQFVSCFQIPTPPVTAGGS